MYGDDILTSRGVFDENGNWSEVHVQASLDDVVAALVEIFPGSTRHQNVCEKEFPLAEDGCIAAQLEGHSWTNLTGFNDSHSLISEAQQLSEKLNAKAFFYAQSDTSGAIFYEFFESGQLLEKLVLCDIDESFESKIRDVAENDILDDPWGATDQFWTEQDALVCYLAPEYVIPRTAKPGEKTTLSIPPEDAKRFVQVDYLELTSGN